jgi:predicted SnoaL-like aldol condensation-catalyzing enzyme
MNNKDKAIDFLQLAAAGNSRAAFTNYVAENFIHHNPYFAGDADSLMRAMAENAAKNPAKLFTVQRAVQENNLVMVHSKVQMNTQHTGVAVVHIFKFDAQLDQEKSRIIELWDIGQPVPESSPNENGMF